MKAIPLAKFVATTKIGKVNGVPFAPVNVTLRFSKNGYLLNIHRPGHPRNQSMARSHQTNYPG
ncbi:hypothetical protein G9A89_001157 [Geosiphon pyriformis]|nr:hypothetical protein G9A89_001157 [Geosiphon pyriformis]